LEWTPGRETFDDFFNVEELEALIFAIVYFGFLDLTLQI
jgi:hypothetical protein